MTTHDTIAKQHHFMELARTALIALFLVIGTSAWSQAKDPAAKAKVRTEQMAKDLGLDAERTAEVEALNRIHYMKMAEIKASGEDKETIKAKSKRAKEVHKAALKRVLTPAQFKRMEVLEAERKAAKKNDKKKVDGEPKEKAPEKSR